MLVLSAILTTIATVCLSSSEYVAMILNARMYLPVYKNFNLNTVGLAHIITEVAVYMGALVPWSAGALLSSKLWELVRFSICLMYLLPGLTYYLLVYSRTREWANRRTLFTIHRSH